MIFLRNIFLAVIGAAVFAGCDKTLLDTIPNDRVSSAVYWKTDKDAMLAANAIYPFLDGVHSWDGMSDIGHITLMWRNESLIEKNAFDATMSTVYNEWSNAYTAIRTANSFLENVDKVETKNPGGIERLKAEVRALRAIFYIRLASLFGDVPLITTAITVEESRTLTRTPVEEVWDFIDQELTEAAAILPATIVEKGRITKGAALGMRARAALYAGRFETAAAAARQVMDLDVYSLYPSYKNLFGYAAENNPEVILDKQYVKSTYANNIFGYYAPFSQRAQGGIVPTKEMVDTYEMTNGKDITDPSSGFDPYDPYTDRDPRLKYTVYVLGDHLPDGSVYDSRPGSGTGDALGYAENSTPTGFNIKKYVNPEDYADPNNCGINIILMRYAEILLTYAEGRIESNQIDQTVLDAINEVRQRTDVNMPPIVGITVQADLREIVRKERQVELAFENLRYFDIRRWKIAEDVVPGILHGMTYTNDLGDLVTVSLPAYEKAFDISRDYLWPIPQRERELNPSLSQNPNW